MKIGVTYVNFFFILWQFAQEKLWFANNKLVGEVSFWWNSKFMHIRPWKFMNFHLKRLYSKRGQEQVQEEFRKGFDQLRDISIWNKHNNWHQI